MSFKDDFFEALRSVKRDFIKDSDDGAQDNAASFSAFQTESPLEADSAGIDSDSGLSDAEDFVMPADIIAEDNASPAYSDEDVMNAFNKASALNDSAMEIDDSDDDDIDSAIHRAYDVSSGNADLFRTLDSDTTDHDFIPSQTPPTSNNARKIYDFDPGDMYSDDKTIISRNTIIRGALHTEDSVRLLGQILGDIDCKSNIVVAGKVRGNTSAANAYIIDAQIDGNMLCDDSVNVNKDAWVLGNIRAQQAEIDGKVKGNIEIRHAVSIGSASSVIGNISTDELEIKRGAFVNGQIIMYSPSRDVLDRFEDFDRQ